MIELEPAVAAVVMGSVTGFAVLAYRLGSSCFQIMRKNARISFLYLAYYGSLSLAALVLLNVAGSPESLVLRALAAGVASEVILRVGFTVHLDGRPTTISLGIYADLVKKLMDDFLDEIKTKRAMAAIRRIVYPEMVEVLPEYCRKRLLLRGGVDEKALATKANSLKRELERLEKLGIEDRHKARQFGLEVIYLFGVDVLEGALRLMNDGEDDEEASPARPAGA